MANNFINRGEVLTLRAAEVRESGRPYREYGFNGVALIDAHAPELYTFQIRGVFEFHLSGVEIGDLIYIMPDNQLVTEEMTDSHLYGRAVTPSDPDGDFNCLILQSE